MDLCSSQQCGRTQSYCTGKFTYCSKNIKLLLLFFSFFILLGAVIEVKKNMSYMSSFSQYLLFSMKTLNYTLSFDIMMHTGTQDVFDKIFALKLKILLVNCKTLEGTLVARFLEIEQNSSFHFSKNSGWKCKKQVIILICNFCERFLWLSVLNRSHLLYKSW